MQRSRYTVIDCPQTGVPMPSTQPLLHVLVPQAMIDDLDDYRFEQRFRSRAAAIKSLIAFGLEQRPTREIAEAAQEQRYGKRPAVE